MSLDSKHPKYSEFIDDWLTMRHTYRGERVIKEQGTRYLPYTSGQIADGAEGDSKSKGRLAYEAYKKRAVFHPFVSQAVEGALGVMHHKPPTIELPSALESMREKATVNGEGLEQLLRRINEAQLVTGRYGLLLDVAPNEDGTATPYIATYNAEHIINWDQGNRTENVLENLNLVVLDESSYERDSDLNWEFKNKYRVLVLGDLGLNENADDTTSYRTGVFDEAKATLTEAGLTIPSIRGNTLEKIPFVFVNSQDILPDPDDPSLLGLARLALAIYRGEADYRQSLFMQGQDTLVIIGSAQDDGNEMRVGANAMIGLPIGGDAKWIGVDSQGLPEMRQSLENDRKAAGAMGGQLLDTTSREKESGDALKVRIAGQTATLNEIALSGAFALQTILRDAATWMGANPEEVVVTPNLDFADDELGSKTLVEYMTAKTLGAPLSLESIHSLMQDKGLTQMEFEEELDKILEEGVLTLTGTDAGGDEEDDEEEPENEPTEE